ncbi:MAG: hypothetical protein A2Z34_00635 [Planctomycetes bacterium RBG_16_59_8]|nr:MAG: hypothetical protein A2Z34_00635 [Planctomycetes bacterium RBG_16_59_8]
MRVVLAYNTAREIFPDSAIADWFDFNRSEFFRVPACETLPVRVNFHCWLGIFKKSLERPVACFF